MATGLSTSIEGGHDVIYDYCCTTCASKNLNAEALFYCKDCSKLFCDSCERYHDKFTKGHGVLGRKELANWGYVKPVTTSFMCEEHPGKELEMYCGDHDSLCCHTCISVKHRACKIVKPVSEVSKGIQKNPDFVALMSEATRTQSRLRESHDSQESTIKWLHEFREEIIVTFHGMRKRLSESLDRLEAVSIKEMDSLIEMLEKQITLDKHTCTEFYDSIQKLIDGIRTHGKECDELAFQGYKKCSKQMTSAGEMLSSLQNVDYRIKFNPDDKIEQCLSSIEKLGTFHVSPCGGVDELKSSSLANPLTPTDHLYSVVNSQTHSVTAKGDKETTFISGICQLPNGQTVIVDHENDKVKLLHTSTYSVLHELKLPPKPIDICPTKGTELAVTVTETKGMRFTKKGIHFINAANGRLSHMRTVQTDHECGGIAYHNAQLYVGSSNALYVYNMSGNMVKKLYEGNSSGSVYRFSLSDDGTKIYVTDRDKFILLTLDRHGNKMSTFSDPELQYPRGICLAQNSSVFICAMLSNTILQVDKEGKKKMTKLATKADGINLPMSLCYDKKTQSLLVGYTDLLVLQLK